LAGFSEYGSLCSVRHQTRKIYDVINKITAKFGKQIVWNNQTHWHIIELENNGKIYFCFHGNKFACWLELLSYDRAVLQSIKQKFPESFKAEVETKQGFL